MWLFWRKKKKANDDYDDYDERGWEDPTQGTLELTHVGAYEIVARIGAGGMGTVYKAIDRVNDKVIAIKVLNREYDLDKKRRKKDYLGREIQIAAALNHECIVRMHPELVEQEDTEGNVRRCLLMEFVDGHSLRKHIVERDLQVRHMIDLAVKLCKGLDFLHQQGVVHRDVKPENFLITRDNLHVKIVDFGLSKSNASWRMRFMREGGGTRRYMSPEQLAKNSVDARSDIFSLGLTLYELFTGKHPCNGADIREIQRQICKSSYRFDPPSKHNPQLPPALDKILLKMLRRGLDSRYQSVTEVLMDLSRIGESRI
jgi:serine/threonine-protein kinase